MAEQNVMSDYFAALMTAGEVTRERAEGIVRDLVEAGDLRRDQFEAWVDRLIEWGRATTEAFVEFVRTEVSTQLTASGLVSREDMSRLDARLDDLAEQLRAVASAPARRTRKAFETARKRAPTKRAPTKKAPTKKAPTKKATAKKATAKKATAKKATAKKAMAKKAMARRAAKHPTSSAKKSRRPVKRVRR